MLRKRLRFGFLFAALMLLFAGVQPAIAQDDYGGDADYQEFYDELDPYGQWVSDPDYGYVWIPDAGDEFRPYSSNGHWAYTDYGNTWVSDYSWGWAPFHYGRWTYHNYYGWMWIPGNTWGPAWVSWRSGGGNYGWAPLGPGVSINIAIGGYNCPNYWWNFAPQQYIFDRNWDRYSYGPRYNNTYINQTTIINNTYIVNRNTYLGGPRRDDLRQATGRDVRPLAVNNLGNPRRSQVRGDRLNLYRPSISPSRGSGSVRPREFRAVERPIRGNTPASAAGFGSRVEGTPSRFDRNPANDRGTTHPGRDRDNRIVPSDRQQVQPADGRVIDRDQAQPDLRFNSNPRRFEQANPGRAEQQQPQSAPGRFEQSNPRRFEQPQPQVQPQSAPRRFEQSNPQRFEQAQPQVQPQAAPRRFEQPQQPQRSFEQRQPQQPRFERPQPAPQPMQQPRFERAQPAPQQQRVFEQRQAPAQQPQRMEAPRPAPQPTQAPGGFGGQRGPGPDRGGRVGR